MRKFTLCAALAAIMASFNANAAGSVNIPTSKENPFDLKTAEIEKNSSFSPNVKDNGDFLNLDYFGEGDVAVFALNNTKETAYKITFETATPQDVSNADFEILNEAGTSIYKKNALIEKTGESGGDWGNYVTNATLPETPVMPTGKYTLKITMHQGTLWETFTANIRNIAFTAAEGGSTTEPGGEVADQKSAVLNFADGELSAVETASGPASADNCLTWKESGFKLVLQNTAKAYSGANNITVNETSMKTIKLSNGAENILYAPEGMVITKLTLYSYINYDKVKKGDDGRVCYWKKIGDKTYDETTGTILKDYISDEGYQEKPDKIETPVDNAAQVSFTNTGEQLCFVIEVTYGKASSSSIENVEIARPVMEDGVIYNLQGMPVDEYYKGIVIKNGKKYLQK